MSYDNVPGGFMAFAAKFPFLCKGVAYSPSTDIYPSLITENLFLSAAIVSSSRKVLENLGVR